MKKISLEDLAKFPDAWKKLCPTLDITKPPAGHVYLSPSLLPEIFGDGVTPPSVEWFHGKDPLPSAPIQSATLAVPREQWPENVKRVAALAVSSDMGVGDVVKRLIDGREHLTDAGKLLVSEFGAGDTMLGAFKWLTGLSSCACAQKQADLNARYPLEHSI
jgi:hypothetical protein